ncbi:hypothetical protein M408DRAFT_21703 [Serendipita vermifera MAFF 305830]|uniref:F-box domain-containing protein n=1 Tax=Serendipita vermifera MAFF 305830 TaxID=933852 RepID=A0A0C3BHD3_SERVB|nr:hypothetical protein M408DRAFT_21703 [Serendipita vermifera MAFF 305830]
MAACSLAKVPYDVLLLIVGLLRCEDSLHLIQTCTSLYHLTDIKAFWLKIARMLQQSRPLPLVHPLSLEGLDIPELRTTIIRALRLESKWSGREGTDPSPLKCMEIEPAAHTPGHSGDDRRITWVRLLHDGIHMSCAFVDEVVQLWHLPSNKLILTFDTGGTLVKASQNTTKDHWMLVGTVDMGVEEDMLCLWKYSWSASEVTEGLVPVASHLIPGRVDCVFNVNGLAGLAYIATELDESFTQHEADEYGFLVFQTAEWELPSRPLRRFTPLGYFPDNHAMRARDDLTLFGRNSLYMIVGFDYLTRTTVYAYDMHLFNDFSNWEDPAQVVYPHIKVEYELHPEDARRWQSSGLALAWSQCTMSWNNSSIGTLGFYQLFSLTGEERCFLSVSTLSLSPLAAHDESGAASPEEYRRCLIGAETSDKVFCNTERGHLFVCRLGLYGINCVWPLSHPGTHAIKEVVIARFFSGDQTQISFKDSSFDIEVHSQEHEPPVASESSSTGIDNSDLGVGGTVVNINVESWISRSEIAEDICLDDRHGRVAIGTSSGKVLIFDFL